MRFRQDLGFLSWWTGNLEDLLGTKYLFQLGGGMWVVGALKGTLAVLPSITAATWSHACGCHPAWQKTLLIWAKPTSVSEDNLRLSAWASIIVWVPKIGSRGQKSERFSIWGLDILVLTVAWIRTQWVQTVKHWISENEHPAAATGELQFCSLQDVDSTNNPNNQKMFPRTSQWGCHGMSPFQTLSRGCGGSIPEFWPRELWANQ